MTSNLQYTVSVTPAPTYSTNNMLMGWQVKVQMDNLKDLRIQFCFNVYMKVMQSLSWVKTQIHIPLFCQILTLWDAVSSSLLLPSSCFTSSAPVISISLSRTIFTDSTGTGTPSCTAWRLSSNTAHTQYNTSCSSESCGIMWHWAVSITIISFGVYKATKWVELPRR